MGWVLRFQNYYHFRKFVQKIMGLEFIICAQTSYIPLCCVFKSEVERYLKKVSLYLPESGSPIVWR